MPRGATTLAQSITIRGRTGIVNLPSGEFRLTVVGLRLVAQPIRNPEVLDAEPGNGVQWSALSDNDVG
jgi:hypothetical protein